MFDAQLMHRQREIERPESAIIIGSKHFWFAELNYQITQNLNGFCRAFIGKFKRQMLTAAVINHAEQRVRLSSDADIRPIQAKAIKPRKSMP